MGEYLAHDLPIAIDACQGEHVGKGNAAPEVFFVDRCGGYIAVLFDGLYDRLKRSVDVCRLRSNQGKHVGDWYVDTLAT